MTLKYHDTSKENQPHQRPQESEQKTGENRKYLESKNQQSDANRQFSDGHAKSQSVDHTEKPNHLNDNVLSSRRETVEQSIKRRNVLIKRLLNSQIDPPISPKKMETIRFVNVASPPLQEQSENYRRIDEHTSPSRPRNDRFDDALTSPVELDMYCRSPKSVSFHPQPQSKDDVLTWKTKQQEVFLTGLKQKENEHLKSLAEEWLIRQNKEEEKLAAKMKKCKLLTEALEHALSAIKVCSLLDVY